LFEKRRIVMVAFKKGDVLRKNFSAGITGNGLKSGIYVLDIAVGIRNNNCFRGIFDSCNQPCRV